MWTYIKPQAPNRPISESCQAWADRAEKWLALYARFAIVIAVAGGSINVGMFPAEQLPRKADLGG